MNIKEKLNTIKERLFLNDKQLCELLNIKKNELNNIENTSEFTNRILKTLIIQEKELLDSAEKISIIKVKKNIDMSKYQNIFRAYSEILKFYYPKPCHIYVLTKIKMQNFFESTFSLFFKNNKASIINEMNTFTPSYLIEKNNKYLLVNIGKNFLYISEVDFKEDQKYIIHDGYKYKKANEIDIK